MSRARDIADRKLDGTDLELGDNDKAVFGDGSDLQIYHNGSNNHSYIEESGAGGLIVRAGNIYIQDADGHSFIYCEDSGTAGKVELSHGGSAKLATTSTGVDVTGTVTADGLTVDAGSTSLSLSSNDLAFDRDTFDAYIRQKGSNGSLTISTNDGVSDKNRVSIQGDGDVAFYEDTGTTAKFFWDASAESLGVGTTAPENYTAFNYGSTVEVSGGRGGHFIVSTGDKASKTALSHYTDTGDGILKTLGNNKLHFSTNDAAPQVTLDTNGNVGIGTSSPAETLEVLGNALLTTGYKIYGNANTGSTSSYLSLYNAVDGGIDLMANYTTSKITFGTNATERMRIDSSGNVGIGTSSPSSYGKLAVAGTLATLPDNNGYALLAGRYSSGYPNATLNSIDGVPWVIQQGGSERMRIDSSGNVGIGTSSPASTLDVRGNITINTEAQASNPRLTFDNNNFTGASFIEVDRGTNAMEFWNQGAERMRIDSSGNVGIGTSSPTEDLTIAGTKSGNSVTDATIDFGILNSNGNSKKAQIKSVITSDVSSELIFSTTATHAFAERMRIDASGSLVMGRTSAWSGPYQATFDMSGDKGLAVVSTVTGTTKGILFYNKYAGEVGSITYTNTSTSYNTSSDYRLKEDWQPMVSNFDRVSALKPVNFAWKADGSRVDGFLAHELADVVPEAVTGTKDAMRTEEYEVTPAVLDDEGNVVTEAVMGEREVPDYQAIDQSKLVPLLTAALQDAIAEIETLKADVAQLKGTN